MAMSVAGSGMQASNNAQYVKETDAQNLKAFQMSRDARTAEQARQADMEAQATASVDKTRDDLSRENFDETADASSAKFIETLAGMPAEVTADTRLAGQEGASVAVRESITKQINSAAADTRGRVQALADLSSFGRAGEGRATAIGQAGDFASTLGGLRRGSLAVGQQEQEIPAASVKPGSSIFADILKGVGGMAAYGKAPGAGAGKAAASQYAFGGGR